MAANKETLLDLTADIVSAYVGANEIAPERLPDFIGSVYAALEDAAMDEADKPKIVLTPAVPIEDSLTDSHIICLEDGLPFKSLKRHLRTKYDLTPDAYRKKWDLPQDYPMVAPDYAKERSRLAKKSGLGKGGR